MVMILSTESAVNSDVVDGLVLVLVFSNVGIDIDQQ